MLKFCGILFCGDDADAIMRTVASLRASRGAEGRLALALLFEKKRHLIVPAMLRVAEEAREDGAFCFFGAGSQGVAREVLDFVREEGSDVLLFLRAGDEPVGSVLRRLYYFFAENAEACGLAYLPRLAGGEALPEAFCNLPPGSVVSPADGRALPVTVPGAAVWAEDAFAAASGGEGGLSPAGTAGEEPFLRLLRGVYARKGRFGLLAQARVTVAPGVSSSGPSGAREFAVSCIIPVRNAEKYLREAIDSVVNQTVGFEENVQLILVNDGSPDGSGDICREVLARYPENVVCVEPESAGVSAARNAGLEAAVGEFVAFLDGEDVFDEKFFEAGTEFLRLYADDADFVAFPLKPLGDADGGRSHPLNRRFKQDGIIDIEDDFSCVQPGFAAALVRRSALPAPCFGQGPEHGEDIEAMHRLALRKMRYGVSSGSLMYYRSEDGFKGRVPDFAWHERLVDLLLALADESLARSGRVCRYTQYLTLWLLQWGNANEISGEAPDGERVSALFEKFKRVIQNTDDGFIKAVQNFSYWKKFYLLKLKHDDLSLRIAPDGRPSVWLAGGMFAKLNCIARIAVIEECDGIISVSGSCKLPFEEGISLVVLYRGEEHEARALDSDYEADFMFGQAVHRACVFSFSVPYAGEGEFSFYVRAEGYGMLPARLAYRATARMCEKKGSFVLGDGCLLVNAGKPSSFEVRALDFGALKTLAESYAGAHFGGGAFKNDVALLREYLRLYPLMTDRRIWLFMDRHDRADDNAEWFFRYCADKDDGVERYFVLSGDSPDFARLSEYGKTVAYGSKEHKMLYLFAERNIVSNMYPHPFGSNERYSLFAGLLVSRLVYLRHGVSTFDMSRLLNRQTRNIKLLAASSREEADGILNNGNYGYGGGTVKITGMPRFDGLRDEKTKQIVFMPKWRSEFFPKGALSAYNPDFKDSDFVKACGALLTDARLAETAERYGYELLFRPHPNVYPQIGDFASDPRVRIVDPALSYRDVFARAALLITDYSSVAFDFAYLKKPVIYYQFSPGFLKPGCFDYANKGFGEVVTGLEELTALVESYLQSGCEMRETHRRRVSSFFAHNDGENSRRVYEAVVGAGKDPS
jgi:CDP-glycerol glycerophosphotransferase (TagB/SpsB family)/glycosyltransferase involved in cell wall biosynthesis